MPIFKNIIKVFISIFLGIAFLAPVIIGYILNIRLFSIGNVWGIGLYGLSILIYTSLQVVFSLLNRLQVEYKKETDFLTSPTEKDTYSVGICIVGYRENLEYFQKCLRSTLIQDKVEVKHVVVVIDGCDEIDFEMMRIFEQVYHDYQYEKHTLEQLPSLQEGGLSGTLLQGCKFICINQPHRGKRHAMYTGVRALQSLGCHFCFCTDSDTTLDPLCIYESLKMFKDDENLGAVAGQLYIFNPKTIISFLSSLRYWIAFNIERGAQSFWGNVLCVSGPNGMYRLSVMDRILTPLVNQRLLGNECTYGDDRHLTNLVLNEGKKIIYSHKSIAYTETPITLSRWITQQVRWSKSFFREFFYSLRLIPKQSIFLTVDLIYQFIYPFLLLATIILTFVYGNLINVFSWFFMMMIISIIKIVVAIWISKDARFLLFFVYPLLYSAFLLPIKVYALLSFPFDFSWGTSPRGIGKHVHRLKEILFVGFWLVLLLGLFCFQISIYYSMILLPIVYLSLAVLVMVLVGLSVGYVTIKKRKRLILSTVHEQLLAIDEKPINAPIVTVLPETQTTLDVSVDELVKRVPLKVITVRGDADIDIPMVIRIRRNNVKDRNIVRMKGCKNPKVSVNVRSLKHRRKHRIQFKMAWNIRNFSSKK